MAYEIKSEDLEALGESMVAYYDSAWEAGVRSLMNDFGQSKMGVADKYLDQAKDQYANFKKKSNDAFGVTLKAKLKQELRVYTGNHNDMANVLVGFAEKALTGLAKSIPVPYLGTVVAKAISLAAGEAQKELHTRATAEADAQLNARSAQDMGRMFVDDADAEQAIPASIAQYKLICSLIKSMPTGQITTFEEAITFPGATFKVQAAASSLNIMLNNVTQYLGAMQERLTNIQTISKKFRDELRNGTQDSVNSVLQKAYDTAYMKGVADVGAKKYKALATTTFNKPDAKVGGATQLAAYLANATAMGYQDAWFGGAASSRSRSNSVFSEPPASRGRSGAVVSRGS